MSDSDRANTRFVEGGNHDEASTLQLRGEDTVDALELQHNHPKKAWFRKIWSSLHDSGKRSGKQHLDGNPIKHGTKRTPVLGSGRKSVPKPLPETTAFPDSSDPANTAPRPLCPPAVLERPRGPRTVSESYQAPARTTGTAAHQQAESNFRNIRSESASYARNQVDPPSRATSMHRYPVDSVYMPTFKDQARSVIPPPKIKVEILDPPAPQEDNDAKPRAKKRSEPSVLRAHPPRDSRAPQEDGDAKPRATRRSGPSTLRQLLFPGDERDGASKKGALPYVKPQKIDRVKEHVHPTKGVRALQEDDDAKPRATRRSGPSTLRQLLFPGDERDGASKKGALPYVKPQTIDRVKEHAHPTKVARALQEDDDAKPRATRRLEPSALRQVLFLGDECEGAPKKEALERVRMDPPSSSEAFNVIDPGSVPLSHISGDHLTRDLPRRVHNDIFKIILVSPSSIDKSRLARHLCNQQNTPQQHGDHKYTNLTVDVYEWCPSKVPKELPAVKFSIWDVHGASSGLDERKDFGFHPAVQSIFFSPGSIYVLVWDMACNNPHFKNGGLSCEQLKSAEPAKRALRADIARRILPWLDCIVQRFSGSIVLPVALVPEAMSDSEFKTRCQIYGKRIKEHVQKNGTKETRVQLHMKDSDDVVRVDSSSPEIGVRHLQERILAVTAESKFSALAHDVEGVEEHVSEEEAVKALQVIANTGFIIFFAGLDPRQPQFIFLDRDWLSVKLSCIWQNGTSGKFCNVLDWTKEEVMETYEKHDITNALIGNMCSSCPLLSTDDVRALLKSPEVDCYLERLLTHLGVFIPLQETETQSEVFRRSVYFVPCLVRQIDPPWTFMSREYWNTTLCHMWLFRKGVADSLMDNVSVAVLRALYVFLTEKLNEPVDSSRKTRCRQIHQILCYKNSMVIKIGSTFDCSETETGDVRESLVDIFIGVVEENSPHAVATVGMHPGMQRLIVSGKGLGGCKCLRLWKGGFRCIVDSVRELLMEIPNTVPHVVCYECLAVDSPKSAATWDCNVVVSKLKQGISSIYCILGHNADTRILCGNIPGLGQSETLLVDKPSSLSLCTALKGILPSVVLVGVWDPDTKSIVNVGSGFIVDEKMGLVVTAAHVIFQMKDKFSANIDKPYHGRPQGRAVIAVISDGGTQAVFRYFAEISTHGVSVDACVLSISAKIDIDVQCISALNQLGHTLSLSQMPNEGLRSLPIMTEFQLMQAVCIVGFSQGGEGLYLKGGHISLSVDVVSGNICRHFSPPIPICDIRPGTNVIVTSCATIAGHSGGPCITAQGQVIGILSTSDPTERARSNVVPISEILPLVKKARAKLAKRTEYVD